jgi:hypothetical protein
MEFACNDLITNVKCFSKNQFLNNNKTKEHIYKCLENFFHKSNSYIN